MGRNPRSPLQLYRLPPQRQDWSDQYFKRVDHTWYACLQAGPAPQSDNLNPLDWAKYTNTSQIEQLDALAASGKLELISG